MTTSKHGHKHRYKDMKLHKWSKTTPCLLSSGWGKYVHITLQPINITMLMTSWDAFQCCALHSLISNDVTYKVIVFLKHGGSFGRMTFRNLTQLHRVWDHCFNHWNTVPSANVITYTFWWPLSRFTGTEPQSVQSSIRWARPSLGKLAGLQQEQHPA